MTVAANVQGVDAGKVTDKATAIANAMDFPAGFGVGLGGASRDTNELFSEMGIALLMGIFVMYLVLVMQFGSFTAPLPIMLSLPLSLIGVVLAMIFTGGSLNLMSLIGVIMLMGLVAKNAILLLDCARKEEKQGVDREDALMHAGRVRLRPILMTTLALIAGMMPVAIGMGEGGEFYKPDGGGHHRWHDRLDDPPTAVVPSFYDSIEISRERFGLKFHARAAYGNPFLAFLNTLLRGASDGLVFVRFFYRGRALDPSNRNTPGGTPCRTRRAPGRLRDSRRLRSAAESLAASASAGARARRRRIGPDEAGCAAATLEACQGHLTIYAGRAHGVRPASIQQA